MTSARPNPAPGVTVTVETRFDRAVIDQRVISVVDSVHQEMWRRVVHLQEQGIRDALIRLGWTPPL